MDIKKFFQFSKKDDDNILSDKDLCYKLKYTIECAERYKNTYFWKSSSSASTRRANELMFSKKYPDYSFEYKGDKYNVSFDYRESGSHVYFSLDIYKNDYSKSNLTVIKNLYKKLSAFQDNVEKYNL